MKVKDIRDLTLAEVSARIAEEREQLMRMKLNNAVSAIEKPSRIRENRRMIARLITILGQKKNEATLNKGK